MSEAEKLVDGLFRNGAGTEATRLVMVVDHPDSSVPYRDIGGWCRQAILDRVLVYGEAVRREQREADAQIVESTTGALELPRNKTKVFISPVEFREHHESKP